MSSTSTRESAVAGLSSATRSIVGLAGDLVLDGVRHPVAAAVARAARLRTFADPEAFAARLGIDPFTLRRCEAGRVTFDALPAAYLALLDDAAPEIDLVGLRELAERVDDRAEPTASNPGAVIRFAARMEHSPVPA